MSTAYSHGVFPLVYLTLKKYKDKISENILSSIKYIYMDIVKHNMLLTSELINIMELLEENNIKAIAFKGPTLAQFAYGDITLRQYVDLDILIEKENLEKSYELFLTKSYLSEIDKEFTKNNLFIEKNSDIQFIENKKNILFELHWKLFRNKFSNTQNNINIYEEIQSMNLNGNNVNIFKNELLLVYLCMHGSKHRWERIEWITDIDRLLRNYDMDWEIVYQIAKKYNCIKMLNLGLHISKKLYNTVISEKYLDEQEDEAYKNMMSYIFYEMCNINNQKTEIDKNFSSIKFHYNLNETIFDKFLFLKKTFLELSDNDTISFNSNSILVHYLIKPVRLIKKYILK